MFTAATGITVSGGPALAIGGIAFVFAIFVIAGTWKMFAKAGHHGWTALIPIYNIYVLCKVAKRPGWWLILFLIPIVNIVVACVVWWDVAKAFGKGAGYGLGLIFLTGIFTLILGFGSAEYDRSVSAA